MFSLVLWTAFSSLLSQNHRCATSSASWSWMSGLLSCLIALDRLKRPLNIKWLCISLYRTLEGFWIQKPRVHKNKDRCEKYNKGSKSSLTWSQLLCLIPLKVRGRSSLHPELGWSHTSSSQSIVELRGCAWVVKVVLQGRAISSFKART